MKGSRMMHLCAFMRPIGIHTSWWRYPGSYPDANINFSHISNFAQKLENAKFDAFFMADYLSVLDLPIAGLCRSSTVSTFEPMTLLPALSVVTKRIGLIATASTTYNEPYHIARRFASLDHISNGRAGWNLVTSGDPVQAKNFGRDALSEHSVRYRRAREFFDVVTGLWDSWADDAFVMDRESGRFFDPSKMHILDYMGEFMQVKGPLNIARPVQGWPVIVQAGNSEEGRQIAAETADVTFSNYFDIDSSKAYYTDVKNRALAFGRNPDDLKIMAASLIILGKSAEDAISKKKYLDSLIHPDSGLAHLSQILGVDAMNLDLDAPLPENLEIDTNNKDRVRFINNARMRNSSVRQLAREYGTPRWPLMLGTVNHVANQMEKWVSEKACDGFNIMFPFVPEGLDDVVDNLVPELQSRGLFRLDYSGSTLRDHLRLKRPQNRFFHKNGFISV